MTNKDGKKRDYEILILKSVEDSMNFISLIMKNKISLKNRDKPLYVVCSKEVLKLSYSKVPSYVTKQKKIGSKIKKVLCCPDCGEILKKETTKGIELLTDEHFFNSKGKMLINSITSKCSNCGTPLFASLMYSTDSINNNDSELKKNAKKNKATKKTKKVSLVDFLFKNKIKFDTVIVDEVHEGNNSSSILGRAQAIAMSKLSKKSILLSGTSNNGYAKSIFNVLRALTPSKLKKDGVIKESDFVKKYGILEKKYSVSSSSHNYGRSEQKLIKTIEKEGFSPIVFTKFLVENFIFFTLDEIKEGLPDIVETYIPITKKDEHKDIIEDMYDKVSFINKKTALTYKDIIFKHLLNNPFGWSGSLPVEEFKPFSSEKTIREVDFPEIEFDEDYISAKDEKVIELALEQKKQGRKFCIITYFNGGETKYHDGEKISERLVRILKNKGVKLAYLTRDSLIVDGKVKKVKNFERETELNNIKTKVDGFICEPSLINVGLNLKWCPTYINYMPSYMVNTVTQANRRGYRINSPYTNEIYHLYYKDTLEEIIINRFQTKRLESKAIEANFNVVTEDEKDLRTYSKNSSKLYDVLLNVEDEIAI